uniref:CD151 molecule (Raph blood group) n=1 Tax=Bos indicus x Bos taurus TaxID=30522 RepID=A0A4W2IJF5_BOBOX
MGEFGEKSTTCGTVCLKYLLFTFNCCFWLAGLAVMAVGIWTLALKSDYISLLASGTYLATAYILVVAGIVVMVTGALGCCATFKERRNLLRLYFGLLLIIFLLEIIAGALAYIYYQQLNAELKENLKDTMTRRYHQPGHEGVTSAVDKLQQEFHCCGSNNSRDWQDSEWIRSGEAGGRVVPDSCCKTVVPGCGRRDHASNIYKVEGGCITKLETFIQEHLRIIGAVGLGIACVQVCVCGGVLGMARVQVCVGWAWPVCRCVWGAGHRPCAGVVSGGLGITRVQVCVRGLGIARVQVWCAWGAGHHPCAVCVGGWASPMCRCVVGAVPRPCAVCCGGCASPVCRCVGGAGYRQCTDVVCMGGWASPVCRFVGGWASPVCHVCCGPGLTCSCWPCAQVFGMLFTCCLYKSLKLEHY